MKDPLQAGGTKRVRAKMGWNRKNLERSNLFCANNFTLC